MLQRIEIPDTVLAFRAIGKVEKSDYEKALDPVEAMIADKGEIRVVCVIGEDFDGYTTGASWEDAKLGLGHATNCKKIAIVTNHDGVRHVIGLFGWMVPGEVKTFPVTDQANAIEWAAR